MKPWKFFKIILKEKVEEDKKKKEMQRKLKGMEKYQMLKVRFDETECKNIQLLQEREQQRERQKQEKLILQDFERKNAQLQEFCNEMKDKTTELEREKEKVEK